MALFCRSNIHTLFPLNNVYCKFILDNVKRRTMKWRRVQMEDKNMAKSKKKRSSYQEVVHHKREEARRSILVQVQSYNSYIDLCAYCTQFGYVNNLNYYTANNQHYILVEFLNHDSIKQVVTSSAFLSNKLAVPIKTPTLWFRHINRKATSNDYPHIKVNSVYKFDKDINKILMAAANVGGSVSEQVQSLYMSLRLHDVETKLRYYIASQIEQCLSGIFPDSGVYPFGSSVNGFGKKGCDLDLVLLPNCSDSTNTNCSRLIFQTKSLGFSTNKTLTKHILDGVAVIMNNFIPGIENIIRILHARVPIVKFHHLYTSIDCDFCANNLNAVHMSELLWLYGRMDSRVRPFILFLKLWAHSQNLVKASPCPSITNFSLTLLALFYLQHIKILPSLEELKAAHKDTLQSNIQLSRNRTETLEFLLHDFFRFYADFDFDGRMICLRNGTSILYTRKYNPLYIRNPFEMDLNVSKNVSTVEVARLKLHMKAAATVFRNGNKNVIQELLLLPNDKHATPKLTNTLNESVSQLEKESNVRINNENPQATSNSNVESTEMEENTVIQSWKV